MHYTTSAPEDGRNYRPKQVELIEIINKPLLLHLVGYLYYWQMGFKSAFKGLSYINFTSNHRITTHYVVIQSIQLERPSIFD